MLSRSVEVDANRSESLRVLYVSALAGIALGLLSQAGDAAPAWVRAFSNAGGPWLTLAFACGAGARDRRSGALAGALALVAAVITYYAIRRVAVHGVPDLLRWPVPTWSLVGAVSGAILGAAGTAWRRRSAPVIGLSILVGCLAAEAVFLAFNQKLAEPEALIAVEAMTAVALPWISLTGRRALAATAWGLSLGLVGFGAIVGLVEWIGRVYA